jgi:ABC-type transporter Mla maintaining outer membrane lipid asymmetry ATPase subunit MlaF
MNVVENVAFPLIENGRIGRSEAHDHAKQLLAQFDLRDAFYKTPAELSGGMKKRVSLARALVGNPEVVLFDEPTTGLDPIMMEFVDQMILDTTDEYLLTSVIISHDMASTFRLADRIAVLHDGTIIEVGTPTEIRQSDDERVQSLIRGATKNDIALETANAVDVSEGETAVEMVDVSKSFSGQAVLEGVSMRVPVGKITALIGGSGAGKSVMMKHILRLMRPDAGRVEVFGRDLAELTEAEMRSLRTQIGMLFQHAALFDSMTIGQNVAFPLIERQVCGREEAEERVNEMLRRLSITDIKHDSPATISSGQEKRASLARALITEPPLIIYDEPTTGQDPMMTRQVEGMIEEVQQNFDVTSLVISHDMALTFRLADHVALLSDGKIIAEGPPADLLESDDTDVEEFVFASEVAGADEFGREG